MGLSGLPAVPQGGGWASASQMHGLGQPWVTGSFQGLLGWCLQTVYFPAVLAVWDVWENSHFSVCVKSSEDFVYLFS